jgi:hypothetical protein
MRPQPSRAGLLLGACSAVRAGPGLIAQTFDHAGRTPPDAGFITGQTFTVDGGWCLI